MSLYLHLYVHLYLYISFSFLTSKSGPRPSAFNAFTFRMCFAPQLPEVSRDSHFQHIWLPHAVRARATWFFSTSPLNYQDCSGAEGLLSFRLRHVLRATTACTFWAAQLLKGRVHLGFWLGNVLRTTTARAFSTPQHAKAARSWGAFSMFAYKLGLRHRGMQLLTPRSHRTFEKHGASRLFYFFTLLSTGSFSSGLLLFWLFLFSDCFHHCCCICPDCRKFDF